MPVPFAHRKVKAVYSLLFTDDLCTLYVFYLCSFSLFTAKLAAVSKAMRFCCIVHCVHTVRVGSLDAHHTRKVSKRGVYLVIITLSN